MKLWHRVKSVFRRKPAARKGASGDRSSNVLREFVYLDEVSLRSLLSSQTGEVTDSTSEQRTSAREAEIQASASADPGVIAKAEVASRFQTTNSSTVQTSRKATVQSWFRELLSIPDLRYVRPATAPSPVNTVDDLRQVADPSLFASSTSFERGAIVEFKVRLTADPVFHLGTMVSEFTAMADDFPDMFATGGGLATLREVQPVNKILQRLLAGLIPVRGEAVDYSVVELEGDEYVVHNALLTNLDLERRPLVIVGVTEHLAYWKDLRRVLFSDAEFMVLCRISRGALQREWTPVKLADLFRPVVPGLVDQINAAGRVPFVGPQHVKSSPLDEKMSHALSGYKDALLHEVGKELSEEQSVEVAAEIVELRSRTASAFEQRSAFAALKAKLAALSPFEIDPTRDLALREQARLASGLALFPGHTRRDDQSSGASPQAAPRDERLLDVDFVAIYW